MVPLVASGIEVSGAANVLLLLSVVSAIVFGCAITVFMAAIVFARCGAS